MNISHGAVSIASERRRQIESEGWTPEHDDEHDHGEMLLAAECYIMAAHVARSGGDGLEYRPPRQWPWDAEWWKPSPDPIRNLAKAGALIAAEMDRLHRVAVERSQTAEPARKPYDVARAWRIRDWPGQGSSTPPDWYCDLWRRYMASDEGRHRYPDGLLMPDGTVYDPSYPPPPDGDE